MKARCSPCSPPAGDPAAQRHRLAGVDGPQLAAPVGAQAPGRGVLGVPRIVPLEPNRRPAGVDLQGSSVSDVGAGGGSPSGRTSRSACGPGRYRVAGNDVLLALPQVAGRWRYHRPAPLADDDGHPGAQRPAAFICDFSDRRSNAPVGAQPRQPQLVHQIAGRRAVGGVDHERRAPSRGREHALGVAGQQLARSMPDPNPMPGVGGPPSCSTSRRSARRR